MVLRMRFDFGLRIGECWLDEATKEACADLGFMVVRTKLDDLEFERRRRIGWAQVRHIDGSVTPARPQNAKGSE